MSYSKLLKITCDIYRHIDSVVDDVTHKVLAPAPIHSGVKCRLAKRNVSNADQSGRVVISTVCILYLGRNADIQNGDIVDVNGKRYKVQEPYKPNGHHKSVVITNEGEA